MRRVDVKKGNFVLKEEVEVVFEKRVHPLATQLKLMFQGGILAGGLT